MGIKKVICIILVILLPSLILFAGNGGKYLSTMNFLTIPTDAKSAGAGNTGIASSADPYSHYHNPAKYQFGDNEKCGASLFYSPWMHKSGVNDMGLYAVSGYRRFDSLQTVSASFRYFSLGKIEYFDDMAQSSGMYGSYELSFDAAYSRKLNNVLSAAIAMRYVHSSLMASGTTSDNTGKGQAFVADVYLYYHKLIPLNALPSTLTLGLGITNLGAKISYGTGQSYFSPAQLKLGGGFSMNMNSANKLAFMIDIRKMMVPTDSDDVDKTSLSGIVDSFSGGLSMQWALGAEYIYSNLFKARIGYFSEPEKSGGRQCLSFGMGVRYQSICMDVAYLIPVSYTEHPMTNIIQVSLAVGFPWGK